MIGEEAPSAEGVLKMNCKVLDSSQLKKLDKQEKVLAQEIHSTGKGESVSHPVHWHGYFHEQCHFTANKVGVI